VFKSAVRPLKSLITSAFLRINGQGFDLHPIRWNNRPFLGRLIVYSVSSEQTQERVWIGGRM
jgi:hypothetical protein